MDKNTFIIYQGSGGLIHMLGGLAYCCDFVTKKRNRKLIIDVKNHEAFKNYFSKYFNLSIIYSEDYNIIDKELTHFYKIPLTHMDKNNAILERGLGYIVRYENTFVKINKSLNTYSEKERILYYCGTGGNNRHLILKFIKINDTIMEELKKYKIDKEYIGVHFRNTDIKNDINSYIKQLQQYKNKCIYLATDDYKALDIFKKHLPDTEFITFTKPYDKPCENIHFGNPNKDEIIMNLLIDMYMLYNSNVFIWSPLSLVSKLVKFMRDNNKSIFL